MRVTEWSQSVWHSDSMQPAHTFIWLTFLVQKVSWFCFGQSSAAALSCLRLRDSPRQTPGSRQRSSSPSASERMKAIRCGSSKEGTAEKLLPTISAMTSTGSWSSLKRPLRSATVEFSNHSGDKGHERDPLYLVGSSNCTTGCKNLQLQLRLSLCQA